MEGTPRSPVEHARSMAREALTDWRGINPDYALEACDRALTILADYPASESLADVLRWKGSVLRDCGQHAAAGDMYAQSLAVADSISYDSGRAHALNCFGTIAQQRGDLTRAVAWYQEAQRLAVEANDRRLIAMIGQNLGVIAEQQLRHGDALEHFRSALAALEQLGEEDGIVWVLNNLGKLYTLLGLYDLAGETLDRALHLACIRRDAASEGVIEENRARLYTATGKLDDAAEAATRALGVAAQRGDRTRKAAALYSLGRAMRLQDDNSVFARQVLERALALSETSEDLALKTEIVAALTARSSGMADIADAATYPAPNRDTSQEARL